VATAAAPQPWDIVRRSIDGWLWGARVSDIAWTRHRGPAAIAEAQRTRFAALVRHARSHSSFYREAYRDLAEADLAPEALPAVTKGELMRHFDDWATDPEVTLAAVSKFLADPARIGERFLGRYAVWKSSGTSGVPGIYVHDDAALSTYDALLAATLPAAGAALACAHGVVEKAARAALVAATGDHYASVASWQRIARALPWAAARCFSIQEPLPRLVAALDAWDPAFLASYPTVLAFLAAEREAGRLALAPSLVWSGGENLSPAARARIERAFGCPVVDEYGASECMCIAFGCRAGSLHVNADWVLLEPVDRRYRPSPPGVPSETVLLTNLANRVQPVIRYDLGDSIRVKPEGCPCGSPLPAIEVAGRSGEAVELVAPDGRPVRLSPLAIETALELATPAHPLQVVRTANDRLLLRVPPGDDRARATAWEAAYPALRAYLDAQGLPNVRVALDRQAAAVDPASGKLRRVVVRPPARARRRSARRA
jgi:phenylacetate-CoA ligase